MPNTIHRLRSRIAFLTVVAAVFTACGSDGDGVTDPGNGNPGPQPAIALQLQPTSGSAPQGGSASFTATVTRSGGFSGAVSVSAEGAPSGVVATVAAPQTSGGATTAAITVDVGASVAPGSHSLSVRAAGSGVADATATFTLTVTPPDPGGAANVTVDFSRCLPGARPIWLAFQDGNGPWTRVTPTGHVYTFRIDAAQGGYVWVAQGEGSTVTLAQMLSREEMTAAPIEPCHQGSKVATGTATGIAGTEFAGISLGGGFATASAGQSAFDIVGILEGTHDLIAYRFDLLAPGTSDRVIIRRDLDVPAGGSVGSLDFGSSEAFAPATANVTVTGAGGATLAPMMSYYTGAACTSATLYIGGPAAGAAFPIRGIPADRQRATDFHALTVTAIEGTNNRLAVELFHTLGDRAIALGAGFTPVVTNADGPYRRLRAAFTVPGDYMAGATGGTNLVYTAGDRTMSFSTSFGVQTGAAADITMPDFSGADGWDAAWAVPSGTQVDWFVQITGSTLTGAAPSYLCGDGGWIKNATVGGSL